MTTPDRLDGTFEGRVLMRPSSYTPMTREQAYVFASGLLGFVAGVTWWLGQASRDRLEHDAVMSVVLLVPLAFGWLTRASGRFVAVASPAAAAVCLGLVAGLTMERPFDGHDALMLAWLVVLVGASVGLGVLTGRRAPARNLLLRVLPEGTVESEGLQWVAFGPRGPLGPGSNQSFLFVLENCHDQATRATVDLREVGMAWIGGRARVAAMRVAVEIPAEGFAELDLPVLIEPEGAATVKLWLSVHAEHPPGSRRTKAAIAPRAAKYEPMAQAVMKTSLGFVYAVTSEPRNRGAPVREPRILDEAQLRERFAALG